MLSSYQVLARRTRPQTFAQVIGQEHVTRTLANAISSGRLAHAFVFSGVRGVGKTTTARILAKALNCVNGPTPEPCNQCQSCIEITECRSLDVFEVDAASQTGIDQTRELLETVKYQPASARYRVYIIDEAHGLSGKAFDAFLKTLEEPPPHVKFILATTAPAKLPATILSRCQRYDFRRVSRREIAAALAAMVAQEGKAADADALLAIAHEADGSLRDAISLLDQVLAFADGRVDQAAVSAALGLADRSATRELVAAIIAREPARALAVVEQVASQGSDLRRFCRDLLEQLRHLTVLGVAGREALTDLTASEVDEVAAAATGVPAADLQRWFKILLDGDEEIGRSPYPRLVLERGTPRGGAGALSSSRHPAATVAGDGAVSSPSGRPAPPRSAAPSFSRAVASATPTPPSEPVGASGCASEHAAEPGSAVPGTDAAEPGSRPNGSEPHALQPRWDALVAALQREQLSRFFHLAHSRVIDVDAQTIRIGVTRKEAATALLEPDSRATIEERIAREFSQRLGFEVISPGKGGTAGAPPTFASLERQAREDPVVQLSVELLDGRVEAVVPRNRR